MAAPLVSIIISSLDQERFTVGCIESCLRQRYAPVEVIVVDGESRDRTAALVRDRFPDLPFLVVPEVRRLQREQRSGNAHLRNRGLQVSRGEYLVFIDSDDRLHPDKLIVQVPLLRAIPGAGFVYGDLVIIDENDRPLTTQSRKYGAYGPEVSFAALVEEGRILPHSMLIARSALAAIGGFDETIASRSDWMAQLLLARHFACRYDPRVVGEYRVYAGQGSRNLEMMKRATVQITTALLQWDGTATLGLRKLTRRERGAILYNRGRSWRILGQYLAARRDLVAAIRANPLRLRSWLFLILTILRVSETRYQRLLAFFRPGAGGP